MSAKPLFGNSTPSKPSDVIEGDFKTVNVAVEGSEAISPKLQNVQLVATEIFKKNSLLTMNEDQIVLFGSERQKAIGAALDNLLQGITKGTNPLLFELFTRIKKGVDEANLPEMEKAIQESLKTSGFQKVLQALGLSSVAKRMAAANEKVNGMLTSKGKSLLDLTRQMEADIQKEVLVLIGDVKKLDTLAAEFRLNVEEFLYYKEAGLLILKEGEQHLLELQSKNPTDPLEIEAVKNFEQKVEHFKSRQIMIETIYQKAPTELESIRLSKGATMSTLAETANSVVEEFNDIKSALIKLSVSHQLMTVQAANDERRKLRNTLQNHGTNLMEATAVKAAQTVGINRLEDTKLLVETAKRLKEISTKVQDEQKLNQQRFAEARVNLEQTRLLLK